MGIINPVLHHNNKPGDLTSLTPGPRKPLFERLRGRLRRAFAQKEKKNTQSAIKIKGASSETMENLNKLDRGKFGGYLASFYQEKGVSFVRDDNLPADAQARYSFNPGTRTAGTVFFRQGVETQVFGHEVRHAWQHLELPEDAQPSSPEEAVLYERFIEADAAAAEMAVTIEKISYLSQPSFFSSNVSKAFFASLSSDDRANIETVERAQALCKNPDELKQTMRLAFDRAIARLPAIPAYREQVEDRLNNSAPRRVSGLARLFYKSARRSSCIPFTHSGMRPGYPQKLAAALGDMGGALPGNYLLDSRGPPFDCDFYTRICDIDLEKRVMAINARRAGGLP